MTHYCPAVTFAGRFYVDPEPPETCGTEVEEPGYCPAHEEDDRSDELYDAYLDAKYEENQLDPWGDD
ncbi:hypothetical protein PP357_gp40 [Arthrobacter phage Sarge]|uniref:Uncharacterized protein n=2 Tax=Caudoviricetes TaxID=2731619 RepID=A0AAE8Y5E2_9CAUD|nr:hypothetical protein PP357_gp40 [Arthrobacter phage Sarge]YP_010649666.1 hypothetical protein PP358_gp46 [Arthrobacter phage Shoya]QIG57717.1 hypothetical protein SEA_SHOYA_46 [Arthrobacter phage Shoya]UDL14887.1 hypothetical protein SEA_SARGE_40 [Arthrobacter phage Sarge]